MYKKLTKRHNHMKFCVNNGTLFEDYYQDGEIKTQFLFAVEGMPNTYQLSESQIKHVEKTYLEA